MPLGNFKFILSNLPVIAWGTRTARPGHSASTFYSEGDKTVVLQKADAVWTDSALLTWMNWTREAACLTSCVPHRTAPFPRVDAFGTAVTWGVPAKLTSVWGSEKLSPSQLRGSVACRWAQ